MYSKFVATLYKNNQEIFKDKYLNKDKNQNIISFEFLDYSTLLNIEEETLIRENAEYKFFLDIKNKECMITLKNENIEFDVEVEFCELNIKNNKIILEYMIETDDTKNRLEIEME